MKNICHCQHGILIYYISTCYDFLMLTDVLKIVLRQHVYRGFYDKIPSFFAVFLRIWSICCMLSRQINLNNMEKEEPIIRRVYRKSLNYGATVVSVVSYAFVTVVPPRMSRSFHGRCHTRSMVMERPCPPRWNNCDKSVWYHWDNSCTIIYSSFGSNFEPQSLRD